MHACLSFCVRIYVCEHVRACICMCVRVCVRLYLCVHKGICVCVRMYGAAYLLDGGELKSWIKFFQLLVAGGFLVLSVTLGGVEHYLALEVHCLYVVQCEIDMHQIE